jgi:hypothetical protein
VRPGDGRGGECGTTRGRRCLPAFLAYSVQDSLVAPATQGIPLALAWADARQVSGRTPITAQDVELEQAVCGHNMEAANLDMTAMEAWIDTILANPSSTTTLARAARAPGDRAGSAVSLGRERCDAVWRTNAPRVTPA